MTAKKKLHRNLAKAVISGADSIFNQGYYTDKTVHYLLRSNRKWGAKDRRFVAESLYDAVRHKRLYETIAQAQEPYTSADLWNFFGVQWILKSYTLPEWEEWNNLSVNDVLQAYNDLPSDRSIRESLPEWLDRYGVSELGEKVWEKEIHAQNTKAPVYLRVNELRTGRQTLQKLLAEDGIETSEVPGIPEALKLESTASVFQTRWYKKGYFEMQDASSMEVARMMQLKPGLRVIDACAGAGGKTLHIASLMRNKGQIIALDIHQKKLNELKKRARRNSAFNIQVRHIDTRKVIKKLYESADRLLIDAPCSGSGVIRRNPDYKWKLSPETISELQNTQRELLDDYSKMLKKGGKMVYATCSVFPSENEKQVEWFLQHHNDFRLVEEKRIMTHLTGNDGFYMVLLEKK